MSEEISQAQFDELMRLIDAKELGLWQLEYIGKNADDYLCNRLRFASLIAWLRRKPDR